MSISTTEIWDKFKKEENVNYDPIDGTTVKVDRYIGWLEDSYAQHDNHLSKMNEELCRYIKKEWPEALKKYSVSAILVPIPGISTKLYLSNYVEIIEANNANEAMGKAISSIGEKYPFHTIYRIPEIVRDINE